MSPEHGSPADRRPDDKPYFIDSHCETCGADLIYSDLAMDPDCLPDDVWYDSFTCPDAICPDHGVTYLDWPREQLEALRGRGFEAEVGEAEEVDLADFRDEGGLQIKIHPKALEELLASDLTVEEVLEEFRKLKQDDVPPAPEHHDERN